MCGVWVCLCSTGNSHRTPLPPLLYPPSPTPLHPSVLARQEPARAVHTGTNIEDSLREGDRAAGRGVIFFLLFTLKIFLYLRRVPIIWPAHGESGPEVSSCSEGGGCLQTSKETDLARVSKGISSL